MKKIHLTAKDGIKIIADVYEKNNAIGWLVLVHMMPATKESWQDFAPEAQEAGYGSIAIDLRGHGESDGGPDGFLKFSDKEHQNSIFDLEAGVKYLIEEKKAIAEKIYFIGVSIGANLALQYIAENQEFRKAVLLSAGLDYRGIKTEPLVKNLKAGQKVYFNPGWESEIEVDDEKLHLIHESDVKAIIK